MSENINPAFAIFIILSTFTIYNLFSYLVTRNLIRWLYNRYKKEAASIEANSKIHRDFKLNSNIKNERALLEVISYRRSNKFDLSLVISNIEFFIIAGATYFAIDQFGSIYTQDSFSVVGIVILSWLGIKVLGYHGHWQQPIFGRSIFSVFLLGSAINIFIAIFLGWLVAGILLV